MRKLDISYRTYSCILICSLLILTGCSKESDNLVEKQPMETQASDKAAQIKKSSTEEMRQVSESIIDQDETLEKNDEPIITEVDWSNYFDGINGAAVIFAPIENCYQIYNRELALTQRSPCSTFKIISSLIAFKQTGIW